MTDKTETTSAEALRLAHIGIASNRPHSPDYIVCDALIKCSSALAVERRALKLAAPPAARLTPEQRAQIKRAAQDIELAENETESDEAWAALDAALAYAAQQVQQEPMIDEKAVFDAVRRDLDKQVRLADMQEPPAQSRDESCAKMHRLLMTKADSWWESARYDYDSDRTSFAEGFEAGWQAAKGKV